MSHASDIWRAFFDSLELIVVDEVHKYRGVFGSHVGLVCRRLARICDRLGSDPQFVCCSATIGNPQEHAAMITGQPTDSFALIILCDRRDIGSVSTTEHPQAETSALFIYDSYRGGVGLAHNGYDHIEKFFEHTWELLADCGCSDGCPACIQSPHCGRANEPLDKRLAATLTMALADPSRQAVDSAPKSSFMPASKDET